MSECWHYIRFGTISDGTTHYIWYVLYQKWFVWAMTGDRGSEKGEIWQLYQLNFYVTMVMKFTLTCNAMNAVECLLFSKPILRQTSCFAFLQIWKDTFKCSGNYRDCLSTYSYVPVLGKICTFLAYLIFLKSNQLFLDDSTTWLDLWFSSFNRVRSKEVPLSLWATRTFRTPRKNQTQTPARQQLPCLWRIWEQHIGKQGYFKC